MVNLVDDTVKVASKQQAVAVITSLSPRFFSSQTITENEEDWFAWKDILIHKELFNKGALVVKDKNKFLGAGELNKLIDNSSFILGDRYFKFIKIDNNNSIGSTAEKNIIESSTKKLLEKIIRKSSFSSKTNNTLIFQNSKRRDEVFFGVIAKDLAFYCYPWLSNNKSKKDVEKKNSFEFKQFVTAGCLCGSNVKGADDNSSMFSLIKHDQIFFGHQKIIEIVFDSDKTSAYELMLFSEFEKIAYMINQFSSSEKHNLLYHLPYYDYILFGVELFIRGRMSFDALDDFIKVIVFLKAKHINKITAISDQYDINVVIQSPFDPVFSNLEIDIIGAEEILTALNIKERDVDFVKVDKDIQNSQEKDLVKFCISKLESKQDNNEYYQIWQDVVAIADKNKINNLEDLFKVGNAIIIAIAAKNKPDHSVCSILPVTEKQIQVSYTKYTKANHNYPSIVNLTLLDPVISYTSKSKGLLFYFNRCEDSVSELIEQHNILKKLNHNIINLANDSNINYIEDPFKNFINNKKINTENFSDFQNNRQTNIF